MGKIPKEHLINWFLPANYSDCQKFILTGEVANITPDNMQIAFWTKHPKWIDFMFRLRNAIVKPFGLKSESKDVQKLVEAIRTGSSFGFATIPKKSDNETIICLTDKHLKAYFSIFTENLQKSEKAMYITTVVHFHNWLGRVYFYAIYPFHFLIVRSKIQSIIRLSNLKIIN